MRLDANGFEPRLSSNAHHVQYDQVTLEGIPAPQRNRGLIPVRPEPVSLDGLGFLTRYK